MSNLKFEEYNGEQKTKNRKLLQSEAKSNFQFQISNVQSKM